ncbi:hypothetical protein ACFVGX_36625 [Streptomyces sp. NPDC127113]|uniref:hypothetical protein n=1 Tax=Streptomyces sp. NPDC127113 TaxID=3345365 RepID=UPI0036275334
MKPVLRALLRRIARRCPVHDRASHAVTTRLERQLGLTPSTPPASFTDTYSDPLLIDCGVRWCPRNGTQIIRLASFEG